MREQRALGFLSMTTIVSIVLLVPLALRSNFLLLLVVTQTRVIKYPHAPHQATRYVVTGEGTITIRRLALASAATLGTHIVRRANTTLANTSRPGAATTTSITTIPPVALPTGIDKPEARLFPPAPFLVLSWNSYY